jgi:basic membrane protein A
MKLKALADAQLDTTFNQDGKGNWKIGYVGAFQYAEVISGFTSFYLGVKSVMSNVAMDVSFTNSWFDIDAEGAPLTRSSKMAVSSLASTPTRPALRPKSNPC